MELTTSRITINTNNEIRHLEGDFKQMVWVLAKTITDPVYQAEHREMYDWTIDSLLDDMGTSDGFDFDLLIPAMRLVGCTTDEDDYTRPLFINIHWQLGGIRLFYMWTKEALTTLKEAMNVKYN